MGNRRKLTKARWPRIALSATDSSDANGLSSVTLHHHSTRASIYTLYRQPPRQPKKIDIHGLFIEDAQTRVLSTEFGQWVVKDRKGDFYLVQHWAWPPTPLTFGTRLLDLPK